MTAAAHDHGHDGDEAHSHSHHHHQPGAGDSSQADTAPAPLPDGDLERGAGIGKILFLDAPSGIAGDMLVATLLDLGVPRGAIEEPLAALPLTGYRIDVVPLVRSGIGARRFIVEVESGQPQRTYRQIRELLEAAALAGGCRKIALDAFRLLAEAEAGVHRMPVEDVHFHEVGAVDSIVDIVAVAAAIDFLGARVIASPLPMGKGHIRAQHGVLPLPAPATVSCLRGVPTYDAGIDGELVTPTGACLVATIASEFSRWPDLAPERSGWGGGTKELEDRPNLLRAVLGTSPDAAPRASGESEAPFAILEANVDDMSAEIAAHAVERALEAGALDAWTTPIGMKKGRPAMMIAALARREDIQSLSRVLFAETTTLGVRVRPSYRLERPRRMIEVETAFGPIAVKVADGDGLPRNAAPEFEACRAAALEHEVPLKEVYAAAIAACADLEQR